MKLSICAQGRDNNFNFIRIVAALAVLVTHSFALAIGGENVEPFKKSLGMTMGDMAVDVFFITSGFLVTSSLLNRKSIVEFVLARALRIFPALWVMLILTVFVLGVGMTSLPVSAYLLNPKTYAYLAKCSTLFFGVVYNLPGVFYSNPYKNAVNGSLWSMPYEVHMYALLVLAWLALCITRKYRLKAFKLAIVSYAVYAGVCILFEHYSNPSSASLFMRLSFMFFSGAAFFVLKEYIVLSRPWFYFTVIALSLSVVYTYFFYVVYLLSIAYILLFLAYVPSGNIRKYNSLGDYSYGIYIYAFPVQQSVAALIPGVPVVGMILISGVISILLGVVSWHFLERRALGLKGHCIDFLTTISIKEG